MLLNLSKVRKLIDYELSGVDALHKTTLQVVLDFFVHILAVLFSHELI